MKTVSLSGSPRENVGKKDAKNLRKQGLVPCVAYGGGEQLHFTLDERDFAKVIFTPDISVVNLTIGDTVIDTLFQDVQYHPVSDKILHADFLWFNIDKPVKTSLPVRAIGVAVGVLKGGSMKQIMRKIAVKAFVKDIPDYIDVDISNRDVIIVEDIVDSGLTLKYLDEYFMQHNPSSVKICTLLDKPKAHQIDIKIDYVGFEVGNEFVVGYGLDYAQKYRNLPYIGILKKEIYS